MRLTLLVTSLFLLATLTIAALARDSAIALALDAIGGAFIAGYMLYRGASVLARALPDVVDAPAPTGVSAALRSAIAQVIPDHEFVRLRTRRSSRTVFAEVLVRGGEDMVPTRLPHIAIAIRNALNISENVEISVVLAPSSEIESAMF